MRCDQRQDMLVCTVSGAAAEPTPVPPWYDCAAHAAGTNCVFISFLSLHSCLCKRNTCPLFAPYLAPHLAPPPADKPGGIPSAASHIRSVY